MSASILEASTIEKNKKEKDYAQIQAFIQDNPDYCIHYTWFFSKVMILPFAADALVAKPECDNDRQEVYFHLANNCLLHKEYANYDVFWQRLLVDMERIKERKIEPQIYTDLCRFNARHIILHLNHGDRQYEAHWHQGGDVFYLYQRDCPHQFCVGVVTVKVEPDWTNNQFLAIAQIAIHAYLDGAKSTAF